MMTITKKMYQHPRMSDDLNMIYQLRMELAIKSNVSTNGIQLFADDCIYEFHQKRLVQKPGYLIYLQDIDGVYFDERIDGIYLVYERKQHDYEVYLIEAI